MSVFVHTQTGGIKVDDPEALTLKVMMENAQQVNQPMTEKGAAKRMVTQAVMQPIVPQTLICQLIGGGVPERFPDLHFSLIEFNAYWLSSLVGSMDKCWVTGIGQDADWWIGVWDDTRPDDDQPNMAQLFRLNEKWPYPLMPSEYVQRQFHVSFQDDPVAVACRHITGLSTIVWGNDYPHAEGTFRGSQELLATQMAGVPDAERKAMVGGTLGGCWGSTPRWRPERADDRGRAPLRRARRRRHRRGARHRPGLRAPAGRARRQRRRQRPRRLDRRHGRRRRPGGRGRRRDRRRRRRRRRRHQRRRPPSTGAQALVDAAVERFGRIDVLVNNAGIIRWAGMPEVDEDNLARHLAVHVGGSFNTARAAWPHMVEQGYGRIVMTTSAGHLRAARTTPRTPPPRAAVIGLTRSLATAGADHGIKVNCIAPGGDDPHGRPGERASAGPEMSPDLVAPMVALLAHEDCPVSGEIYAAGAGRFARIFIAMTPGYVHAGAGADDRGRRRQLGGDQRRARLHHPGRPPRLVGDVPWPTSSRRTAGPPCTIWRRYRPQRTGAAFGFSDHRCRLSRRMLSIRGGARASWWCRRWSPAVTWRSCHEVLRSARRLR